MSESINQIRQSQLRFTFPSPCKHTAVRVSEEDNHFEEPQLSNQLRIAPAFSYMRSEFQNTNINGWQINDNFQKEPVHSRLIKTDAQWHKVEVSPPKQIAQTDLQSPVSTQFLEEDRNMVRSEVTTKRKHNRFLSTRQSLNYEVSVGIQTESNYAYIDSLNPAQFIPNNGEPKVVKLGEQKKEEEVKTFFQGNKNADCYTNDTETLKIVAQIIAPKGEEKQMDHHQKLEKALKHSTQWQLHHNGNNKTDDLLLIPKDQLQKLMKDVASIKITNPYSKHYKNLIEDNQYHYGQALSTEHTGLDIKQNMIQAGFRIPRTKLERKKILKSVLQRKFINVMTKSEFKMFEEYERQIIDKQMAKVERKLTTSVDFRTINSLSKNTELQAQELLDESKQIQCQILRNPYTKTTSFPQVGHQSYEIDDIKDQLKFKDEFSYVENDLSSIRLDTQPQFTFQNFQASVVPQQKAVDYNDADQSELKVDSIRSTHMRSFTETQPNKFLSMSFDKLSVLKKSSLDVTESKNHQEESQLLQMRGLTQEKTLLERRHDKITHARKNIQTQQSKYYPRQYPPSRKVEFIDRKFHSIQADYQTRRSRELEFNPRLVKSNVFSKQLTDTNNFSSLEVTSQKQKHQQLKLDSVFSVGSLQSPSEEKIAVKPEIMIKGNEFIDMNQLKNDTNNTKSLAQQLLAHSAIKDNLIADKTLLQKHLSYMLATTPQLVCSQYLPGALGHPPGGLELKFTNLKHQERIPEKSFGQQPVFKLLRLSQQMLNSDIHRYTDF